MRRGLIYSGVPKAEIESVVGESSREVKKISSVITPLPISASTAEFQATKNFWGEISAGDRVNEKKSQDCSSRKTKKSSIPVPTSSTSSFLAAKSFWTEISNTSCKAVVPSGKPYVASSPSRMVCKKSIVSDLSGYTANTPLRKMSQNGGTSVGVGSGPKIVSASGVPKSHSATDVFHSASAPGVKGNVNARTSRSSTFDPGAKRNEANRTIAYQTQAASMSTSATTSNEDPNPETSECALPSDSSISMVTGTSSESSYQTARSQLSAATNSTTSLKMQYNPDVQSQLWDDIMKFCSSPVESSSCPRFCDCDECIWVELQDDVGASTVARVGERNCKAKKN